MVEKLCEKQDKNNFSYLPFGWLEMCDSCPEFLNCQRRLEQMYPESHKTEKKPSFSSKKR